jgi:prophage antirepressor-like protein
MNELARLVSFSFWFADGFPQHYHIVDRDGNPWFVGGDMAAILGIRKDGHTFKNFPENEKAYIICERYLIPGTSAKPRARKTQKVLVINEAGLLRLITRSDKPIARQLQDKIFSEIIPAYRKQGINWAALPRTWPYRGQMLNFAEWRAKKQEAYFKRHPDASMEDFEKSMLPFQV